MEKLPRHLNCLPTRARLAAWAGVLLASSITNAAWAQQKDLVNGNLIMLQDNGGWCWYQDERLLVDTAAGTLLFSSVANHDGFGGEPRDANIDATAFNFATGSRSRYTLGTIPTLTDGDDHNVAALWQRTDGRYVAMYTGHLYGSGISTLPGGGTDTTPRSFYRISTNPNDATSWQAEQAFTWPSNDTNGTINNDVTYSNLLHLSTEGSGQGRLYNIARGPDRTPAIMYSDDQGGNWTYGGLLSQSGPNSQYSNGYFKFTSNGTDRIDFIATEHHPRNYNNSIYHGYIQGGQSFDAAGNLIDADIFDTNAPAPASFTPVWNTDQTIDATAYHHGWTTELERDGAGNLYGLFTTRYGTEVSSNLQGDGDHRLFYARFDQAAGSWSTTELAKMGGQTHAREQDYTGLGAIDPNNPNSIYISTPIDPRTNTTTGYYEIYKGTTEDNGLSWDWTAVTENSTVDNLRPAIANWEGSDYAVVWARGQYPDQRAYDLSMVGLVNRTQESVGKISYIDASTSNTTFVDSSALTATSGSTQGATDNQWHWRTGFGNGDSVLASNELGDEDAPMLKTTLSSLDEGTYDIFAFFWANPSADWRIEAGLNSDEMVVFQQDASQQAQADHFDSAIELVSEKGTESLYRAYVGRVSVLNGDSIDVYIDDLGDGNLLRTWYDGVGYAQVTSVPEPASLSLLFAGGLLLLRRRR